MKQNENRIELTILMPCLNEEKTVGECVTIATQFLCTYEISGEVLICDNGSNDRSVELAQIQGARVVICEKQGYGNALRYGIEQSLGKYVIMGDCDMSYDFSALEEMYQALLAGNALVIGNRFATPMEQGAMSVSHKYFGVPFLSFLGRIRYRTNVHDFHCGLRGVRKDAFLSLGCRAEGMELDMTYEYRFIRIVADQGAAILPLLTEYQRNDKQKSENAAMEKVSAKYMSYLHILLQSTKKQAEYYPLYLKDRERPDINLTEAEKNVLELLVQGLTNKEIADRLFIGIATVKTHTGNIYGKLNARNRAAAIIKAKEYNLIQ